MNQDAILLDFLLKRSKAWTDASYATYGADPYNVTDVQQLGRAERRLLAWEEQCKRTFEQRSQPDYKSRSILEEQYEDDLLNDLMSFSKLWVFGLYEIMRTIKEELLVKNGLKLSQNFPAPFHHFDEFFYRLEVVRMPLAKHQLRRMSGAHRAGLLFDTEYGSTVWEVYSHKDQSLIRVNRREVGDEFLRLAMMVKKERGEINKTAHDGDKLEVQS